MASSFNDRCTPTDYLDKKNTVHFRARAARHAAQINVQAHSCLLQCLVLQQTLINQFLVSHAASRSLRASCKLTLIETRNASLRMQLNALTISTLSITPASGKPPLRICRLHGVQCYIHLWKTPTVAKNDPANIEYGPY